MHSKIFRIWKILGKNNKRKVLIAITLSFFSGIFDLIGIASVLPFLSALAEPELINTNKYLAAAKLYSGLNDNQFIIFLGLASFILIIINQLLRLLSSWFSLAFSENLLYEKSRNLFNFYLERPYKYFLSKSAFNLVQRCTNYVNAAVAGYITPLLLIIAHLFTTFFILLFLVVYQPLITLVLILALTIFYLLVFNRIKKTLSEIGKNTPKYFSQSSKIISDAFNSIKEAKLTSNSSVFVNKFSQIATKYKNSHIVINIFQSLPAFSIEIFAYGILLFVSLFLFFQLENFNQIIPLIGVLTISLKRLIPAAQDTYAQIVQIRFYRPTFNKIINDFEESFEFIKNKENITSISKASEIKFNDEIKFDKVKFSYNSSKPIVYLTTNIKKGQFIGITGKSGHGKTTFLDIFSGLLNANSGKIFIDGKEFKEKFTKSWQNKISYAPQNGYLLNDTIENNIIFGNGKLKNINKIKKICRIVELSKFIEKKLVNKYSSRLGENGIRLSGGQQQRLIIARALYQDPELIILDEATNALDNVTENRIIKNIKKYYHGATIIFVTHRVKSLKGCDKIIFFDEGKIVDEGKYNILIKKNKKFRNLSNLKKESLKFINNYKI